MIDIIETGNEKYKYALSQDSIVLCLLDDRGLDNLNKAINRVQLNRASDEELPFSENKPVKRRGEQ